MKKLVLFLAIFILSVSLSAAEYNYLVFTSTSGTTTALDVQNLTMSVNGSSLIVTNQAGNKTFALAELKQMQFSEDGTVTGLENVLNADRPVQVYTTDGKHIGLFENLIEATQTLTQGVYVITDGKNSQKIVVK